MRDRIRGKISITPIFWGVWHHAPSPFWPLLPKRMLSQRLAALLIAALPLESIEPWKGTGYQGYDSVTLLSTNYT